MKIIPFCFLAILFLNLQFADFSMANSKIDSQYREAYLNTEDSDVPVSVYQEPGLNWRNCKENCSAIGWLKKEDSKVFFELDSKGQPITQSKKGVLNPITLKEEEVTYYKVKFSYIRDGEKGFVIKKDVAGWVSEEFLSGEKVNPIYSVDDLKPTLAKEPPCPPKTIPKKNHNDLKDVSAALIQSVNKDIEAVSTKISNLVGKCPLKPPPSKGQLKFDGLFYDNHVWPQLQSNKSQFPMTLDTSAGAKKISFDDYVNIDAMARTIYGEMAGCMVSSPVFGMTAARVALNRAEVSDEGHSMKTVFVQNQTHKVPKPTLAKVLTAPAQFSVWNHGEAQREKSQNILMTLCPTTGDKSSNNWKGEPPSKMDLNVWQRALKIATEAVVFPKSFKSRTSGVKQFYYTTGIDMSHSGYHLANPTVDGQKVQSKRCIWVWNSPAKERLPR